MTNLFYKFMIKVAQNEDWMLTFLVESLHFTLSNDRDVSKNLSTSTASAKCLGNLHQKEVCNLYKSLEEWKIRTPIVR